MNVAVIGSGVIGRTLAARFSEAGHSVTFGARNPGDRALTDAAGEINVAVASIDDAIAGAEVVLLAIPGGAVADAMAAFGPALDGKIVIDASNNVGADPPNGHAHVAAAAPDAHYFRAFNSLGWENFADPRYGDVNGDMLFAGADGPERATVEKLIGATGVRPIWVGGLDKVKVVDDFVALWFTLAFERGYGRGVGFKILTR
jgi:predicted dinucleotide-binding enzyme